MARTIYEHRGTPPLPSGKMALTPSGLARFTAADLSAAGLKDAVTIEIDAELRTIYLRPPRRGETPRKLTPPKDGAACASMAIGGALVAMGLKPSDLAGRRDVVVDDGELILKF